MDDKDIVIDLNTLSLNAVLTCPYCNKGNRYSYGATGKESSSCNVCHRLVLWDFDRLMAYKARCRKYAS